MYYQINTHKASYNLVQEIRNGKANIYIGGETFTCTEIIGGQLYFDKNETDCFLVKYDSWDASDMMSALILYNSICKIELTDLASNKKVGNLSSYYLAFYGKTLYELNFNAYLKSTNTKNLYYKCKNIFNEKTITNDDLSILLSEKGVILELYAESVNYKNFFDRIKKALGELRIENENVAENFIKPWLDVFIKKNLGFSVIDNETWVIECKNVDLDFTGYSKSTYFDITLPFV